MQRHPLILFLAAGAGLCLMATAPCVTSCSATTILGPSVPLSDYAGVAEASIDVGDKRFFDFMYSYTNEMPDASGVNVIPIVDDDGNYGLRFQGYFTDLASSVGGSDALIEYMVTTTDDRFLISDAHLLGNLVVPDEEGLISVTETFFPLGTGGEYTMAIFDSADSGPQPFAWVDFHPPVKTLAVQKDIGALGFSGSFPPMMSFVDQTFSQVEVPESTTILLALVGVAALAMFMRHCDARARRRSTLAPATTAIGPIREPGVAPHGVTGDNLNLY